MKTQAQTGPIVARYRSTSGRGVLLSAEFAHVGEQKLAFFQCYDWPGLESIRPTLTAAPLSQEVVAITSVSGRPMLVTRGNANPEIIMNALKARGETLEPVLEKKGFDAWKVRSILGFGGQTLQLASSFLRPTRQIDTSTLVFSTSNLAANSVNLVYDAGAQKDDKHQLRYLKQRLNRELAAHLSPGETTLSIEDQRAKLREPDEMVRPIDAAEGFLKRHSVAVGELGLRYLGAFGIAFPARYWKAGWKAKKLPQMDSSVYRRYTGVSSMIGKSVAFTSQIPDPYNPKPASMFDDFRERFAFLTGGVIEMTSFTALAYDSFFHSKGPGNSHRGLLLNGKLHRDWLGGIGATMFVLGYIVRSFAPLGDRNVDMKELYAHASDTLAATPPDKIPQLLANTSASLAEHFERSTNIGFATIYSSLLNDLHRYHHHEIAMAEVSRQKAGDAATPIARTPTMPEPAPRVYTRGADHQKMVAQAPEAPLIS